MKLFDFKDEKIRMLHYTWFAFFITFYVWFNMAPLATTMLASIDWLTREHIRVLAIANVALTIPARILIGALIDRFGPKVVFSVLMVIMGIPAFLFAFGNSFLQLLIARLVLGSIGASFVIGIKMVAIWFPKDIIGRAEGLYAGWGNFGSAWAAMTLPWIAITVFGSWLNLGIENGWRYSIAFSGFVSIVYGFVYYFIASDRPKGKEIKFIGKVEPMKVTSYGDLIQYIVWSFPLVGAMGVLVWRVGSIKVDGQPLLNENLLLIAYVLLGLLYIVHVIKTLQVNLPYLRKGLPEGQKYPWSSVAALNTTYFANFGAELAVVSMLPMFFESVFQGLRSLSGELIMSPTLAGIIASSFAFINLVARPLGGYFSDKMQNRKRTMLIYMIGIALGFLAMSLIAKFGPLDADGNKTLVPMFAGTSWLVLAVVITIVCSAFVQGAEGATFAIIPMIKRGATGQIAGMAGAYGNVGAVCYLVIYSLIDDKTFFQILSAGAFLSFVYCWIFLKEPEVYYKDKY